MDAWEQLTSKSTIPSGDAWEHLLAQGGGGDGSPYLVIADSVLVQATNHTLNYVLIPNNILSAIEPIRIAISIDTGDGPL